jgi:hypothetical protein
MNLWTITLLVSGIYCLARGAADLRQRRFLWGALGIVSCALLWFTPIQAHAVKYDLPFVANSQG